MQLTKPIVPRVHVTVRDPDSGQQKTVTFYNTTVPEFIEYLKRGVDDRPGVRRHKKTEPLAASA